jgi:cell division protein FtsW
MKAVRDLLRPMGRTGSVDVVLAATVTALIGFGIVMVYSASVVEATVVYRDPQYFLKRQAIFGGVALTLMWIAARIDYHRLKALTYPILGGVTVLMVLSVIGFGHSGGGAARWLAVGPVHIQPSEMAKVALVLWLAYSLEKKKEQVKSFSIGLLPHLLMAGMLMVLCLRQPDFGGAVVLLFLTFTMLFVAGARLGYLLGIAMLGALFAGWAVRFTSYRWQRMLAWSNMNEHRQDLAYQPFQAVMSFGSGEFTGLGLGKGLQVLYLPEAHTDFIAAIIGEELGFLGILVLCGIYLVIVGRGVKVALAAADDYGAYISFGISMLFGVQALVNMSVAMAMLPTKGLTLPFISYGGSSLLVNAVAMGILLNVSRTREASDNLRAAPAGPKPEASAMLVSEAGFSADPSMPKKPPQRRERPAKPAEAT